MGQLTKEEQENIMDGKRTNEIEGHVYTAKEKDVFKQIARGELSPEEARDNFLKGFKKRHEK